MHGTLHTISLAAGLALNSSTSVFTKLVWPWPAARWMGRFCSCKCHEDNWLRSIGERRLANAQDLGFQDQYHIWLLRYVESILVHIEQLCGLVEIHPMQQNNQGHNLWWMKQCGTLTISEAVGLTPYLSHITVNSLSCPNCAQTWIGCRPDCTD